ncbi:MAG: hypothetical protein HY666_05895 [Chloroflexi bacterium]|nr:hypothetical protein [Chloroflexota bacterium]
MRLFFPKGVYYGWWVLLAAGVAVFLEAGVGGWSFSVVIKPMAREFGASHAHPWCDDFRLFRQQVLAEFHNLASGSSELRHYCGLDNLYSL